MTISFEECKKRIDKKLRRRGEFYFRDVGSFIEEAKRRDIKLSEESLVQDFYLHLFRFASETGNYEDALRETKGIIGLTLIELPQKLRERWKRELLDREKYELIANESCLNPRFYHKWEEEKEEERRQKLNIFSHAKVKIDMEKIIAKYASLLKKGEHVKIEDIHRATGVPVPTSLIFDAVTKHVKNRKFSLLNEIPSSIGLYAEISKSLETGKTEGSE